MARNERLSQMSSRKFNCYFFETMWPAVSSVKPMKILVAAIWLFASALCSMAAEHRNLVFILTDNHGAWTLGCYGNKEIRTPNIDKLAAEGMLFTRAYCNNSVCSPSRATFLDRFDSIATRRARLHSGRRRRLGRKLIRHQRISHVAQNSVGIRLHLRALRQMASGRNAASAGRDSLIGSPKRAGTRRRFTTTTWSGRAKFTRNRNTRPKPSPIMPIDFLEQNQNKPFFLYLAYNGPYGLGKVVQEEHQNRAHRLLCGQDHGFLSARKDQSMVESESFCREQREEHAQLCRRGERSG